MAAPDPGASGSFTLSDVESSSIIPEVISYEGMPASDSNLAEAIKVFGESGLNEIIMLVGCYVLACMLLRTWGVEIEQPKT